MGAPSFVHPSFNKFKKACLHGTSWQIHLSFNLSSFALHTGFILRPSFVHVGFMATSFRLHPASIHTSHRIHSGFIQAPSSLHGIFIWASISVHSHFTQDSFSLQPAFMASSSILRLWRLHGNFIYGQFVSGVLKTGLEALSSRQVVDLIKTGKKMSSYPLFLSSCLHNPWLS